MSDSTANIDLSKIIFKLSAPPILVGGPGNILPCIESCNIDFDFKQQNKFVVTNQNGKLYVKTDVGAKTPSTKFQCYQTIDMCSAENCPAEKLFKLEDIIITCPSLHRLYINGSPKIFDGEVFIVFKNEYQGNTVYNVFSILLEQTTDMSTAVGDGSINAYKLFESLGKDLPDKNEQKTVSTLADWDIKDLFPKNKWFYNYTHPNNPVVNWYVYKNQVYVPNSFKSGFISTVSQVNHDNKILTGTQAYNTLYSAIGKLQNPTANDNSFVIFEQRDLENPSGTSSTDSRNVAINNANSVAACKAILNESGQEEGSREETTEEDNQKTTEKRNVTNNYETGSTRDFFSDEEDKDEEDDKKLASTSTNQQIDNKTRSVTMIIYNVLMLLTSITFVGLGIYMMTVARKPLVSSKVKTFFMNMLSSGNSNLYFIMIYVGLFFACIIINSVYMSLGYNSKLAKANTGLAIVNWICYSTFGVLLLIIYLFVRNIPANDTVQGVLSGKAGIPAKVIELTQQDIGKALTNPLSAPAPAPAKQTGGRRKRTIRKRKP